MLLGDYSIVEQMHLKHCLLLVNTPSAGHQMNFTIRIENVLSFKIKKYIDKPAGYNAVSLPPVFLSFDSKLSYQL